ncbi:DUF1254 domain-containing protein [Roseibium hamelinense]|uniref:DUF1254 domain-containing protein n=1 Tax=Roseibium hamelinense TaxID=150831 RepID=UPI003CC7592D
MSRNEKGGILTPNLTTPYIFNFVNLSEAPLYLEVPAAPVAGAFLDAWQRPVADIGETGPDKGEGGSNSSSDRRRTRPSTKAKPTSWCRARPTTSRSPSGSSTPRRSRSTL